MAENEQNNAESGRPDISFGNDSPGGQSPKQRSQRSGPRPAGQGRDPGQGTVRPVIRGEQGAQEDRSGQPRRQRDQRPADQDRQGQPRRGQNGGQPRRPQETQRSGEGQRRQSTRRPDQEGRRPESRNSRRQGAENERQSRGKMAEVSRSPGGGAAAVKKKGRFTKKQALQVTGLIFMLILIFGLAVFLVFDHYFSLLKHEAVEISNSEPMTYSDVDFSKPDTFEKSVEDEKLKELTAEAKKITSEEVMNILLIGEDLRDTTEERSVGNTDVMMLISVNKKDKTITLTSLMRDCYVAFEDENGYWYSDRINAAYWYGGIKLTKQTIENYMNVKIDRYVLVNFKVFIDIVDTLGGIDMYVTDEEANGDPDAPRDDKEHRGMQNPLDEQNKYLGNKKKTDYIKKGGNLHLNGNQALAYARLRYIGDADFDRTKRQRKVINEMIKESRKMSLIQMDQLANKVFPQVTTDVTMGELAGLLLEMLDYRNYKVQELRIPSDNTFTNEFIDGKAVLSVDFPANVEKFRKKAYGSVEFKEKEKSEDGKALE